MSSLDSIYLTAKLYEHKKPFSLMVYDGGDHRLSQYKQEGRSKHKRGLSGILQHYHYFLKQKECSCIFYSYLELRLFVFFQSER